MSKINLSHSACSKYQMCGYSYKLHYIDKIRPRLTHAALLFGSALDNALNELLVSTGELPEKIFKDSFEWGQVNNVHTYLPTNTKVVYANSDMDYDLLDEALFQSLEPFKEMSLAEAIDSYRIIEKKKKAIGFDLLPKDEKILFNALNWCCLHAKGLLMLDGYRKQVMPRIKSVLAVQRKVELSNADGDGIVGYVDLVADIEGEGVCVLDNKTSSRDYEADSVILSPQLSLYLHILEEEFKTRKCGYIVLNKHIIKNKKKVCKQCGHDGSGSQFKTCNNTIDKKRCNGEWTETISPEVKIQFIVDEIPEQTENIVMSNYDEVADAIKKNTFTRNLSMCSNYFGGKCPYFQLCYYNKKTDLIELKEK